MEVAITWLVDVEGVSMENSVADIVIISEGVLVESILGAGLLVTSDPKNSSSEKMSALNGKTPETLNPDMMLEGVKALWNLVPSNPPIS